MALPFDVTLPTGQASATPETRSPDDYQEIQPRAGAALAEAGQGALQVGKVFGQVQVDNVTNGVISQARDLTNQFSQLRGIDAYNAQGQYQQKLQQIFDDGEKQLGSIDQINAYRQDTRRYQDLVFGDQIARGAAQGFQEHAVTVNNSLKQGGLDQIASDPNNDASFQLGVNRLMQGTIKQLQLEGNASDPDIVKSSTAQAMQAAWATRIQAVAVNDPATALQMAQKNQGMLGDQYARVVDPIQMRANEAIGVQAGQAALAGAGAEGTNGAPANVGPATPAAQQVQTAGHFTPQQIWGATLGNESAANLNEPTSVNGAVGAGQIVPATFEANAKPGQNINNPVDNLDVSRGLIQKYYQQYGGDWQRVAVAYFSGPGNVAPVGSTTPWIHDTKDGNGTAVSSYVAQMGSKLNADNNPAALKANAYSKVLDDPNLSPIQKEHAISFINQSVMAQQVAQQATEQQQEQANRTAANQYTTDMLTAVSKGGTLDPSMLVTIAQDPNLQAATKTGLFDLALRLSGKDTAIGYGNAYTQTYSDIVSGKVRTPQQILTLVPSGQVTPAGAQSLISTLGEMNRGGDAQALASTRSSLLAYAKTRLSFQDDSDPYSLKDPQGEELFNAQFVPQFMSGYEKWVDAGKDPTQYLTKDNVDKLVTQIRSPQQMAQAKVAAENGLYGDNTQSQQRPNAPLPAAPEGINASSWGSLVSDPPLGPSGPISYDLWGRALSTLLSDPKKYSPYFDQQFGPSGYTAAAILAQLSQQQQDQQQDKQAQPGAGHVGLKGP